MEIRNWFVRRGRLAGRQPDRPAAAALEPLEPRLLLDGGVGPQPGKELGPDLIVAECVPPYLEAEPGQTVALQVTTINIGDEDAYPTGPPYYIENQLFLSDDPEVDQDDRPVGAVPDRYDIVYAGDTHVHLHAFPAPPQPGTYYLMAMADTGHTVFEADEYNNWGELVTMVVGWPDLVGLEFYADADPEPARWQQEVPIGWAVGNYGNTSAGPFDVGFYLSRDPIWDPGDVLLGSESCEWLAPEGYWWGDGSVSLPARQELPAGWPSSGQYYILMYCDHLGAVAESDEGNNYGQGHQVDWDEIPIVGAVGSAAYEVWGGWTDYMGEKSPEDYYNIDQQDYVKLGQASTTSTFSGHYGFYVIAARREIQVDAIRGSDNSYLMSPHAMGNVSGAESLLGPPDGCYASVAYQSSGGNFDGFVVAANPGGWMGITVIVSSDETEGPDLIISNSDPTALHVLPGQDVSIRITTRNVGDVVAMPSGGEIAGESPPRGEEHPSGYFETQLFLSPDPVVNPSDLEVASGQDEFVSLAPGDSRSRLHTFRAPTQPGTYYLKAMADEFNAVVESDESNNWGELIALHVGQPDLVVSAGAPTYLEAPAGGAVSIDITTSNVGNAAALPAPWSDHFETRLFLSPDAVVDRTDLAVGVGQGRLTSLDAGASHTHTFTFPAPPQPGTYYLAAVADELDAVGEFDEGNNWGLEAITLVVTSEVDLLVSHTAPSTLTVLPSQPVSLDVTTRNAGDAAAVPAWPADHFETQLFLSDDTFVDQGDQRVAPGQGWLASLDAQTSHTHTFSFLAPAQPGTYYLAAMADGLDSVTESDEDNNWGEDVFTLIVLSGPDLVVSGTAPAQLQASPGEAVSVDVNIANVGGQEALPAGGWAYFQTQLYLSTDASVDQGDQPLADGQGRLASLGAGASHTHTFTFAAPTQPGMYYLGALADELDAVSESVEANNWGLHVVTLLVVSGPDLVVTDMLPALLTAGPGETVSLQVTTENRGNQDALPAPPADGFETRLCLSTDDTVDGNDQVVADGQGRLASLGAGAGHTHTFTFTAPAQPGVYFLGALADESDAVGESVEGNNWAPGVVRLVVGLPDLAGTYLQTDAPLELWGQPFIVEWSVANHGDVPAPGFSVGFYLSRDADWDPDDVLIGGAGVPPGLAPGEQPSGSKPLKLPPADALPDDWPLAGTMFLVMYSDHLNAVSETDEQDNHGLAEQIDWIGFHISGQTDPPTYEVWGGDTDYTDEDDWCFHYYNIHQQDYVKLGEADRSSTFDGDYDFYVVAARREIDVDTVLGSTGEFVDIIYTGGNLDHWDNIGGPPDNEYGGVGVQQAWGRYRGFIVIQNPGDWTAVTVIMSQPKEPDLVIGRGGPAEVAAVAGQSVVMPIETVNIGERTARPWLTQDFGVALHLSTDQTVDFDDQLVAAYSIPRLQPGDSHVTPVSFRAPSEAGTYYLAAVADDFLAVHESNEQNNWGDVTILTVREYGAHVLCVGVRDEETSLGGDLAAARVHDAFGLLDSVRTNELLLLNTADAGNKAALADAVDAMTDSVLPGDTFIFYFASHGGYFLDGDEEAVQAQYDADDLAARQETTGDEYLHLSRAAGADDIMTDDEFSQLFVDPRWEHASKLFIIDTCFSGGHIGNTTYGDSGDLSRLGNAGVIGAAAEGDFGWAAYDPAEGAYVHVLGTALAEALTDLQDEPNVSFDDLFQQTAVHGSVFNGTTGRILALEDQWAVDAPIEFEAFSAQTDDFTGWLDPLQAVPIDARTEAKFTDADGDEVTVSIRGDAFGHVMLPPVGWGDAVSIQINSSDPKASLTIKAKPTRDGGNGETAVGDIEVNGSLSKLNAGDVDLAGDLTVTGTLGKLTLDDVADGHAVTIGPPPEGDARATVAIRFGQVADTSISSLTPIKSLTAVEWLNTDGLADQIQAPSLGKLAIKGDRKADLAGDFQADLILDGTGARKATLGSAKIAGDLEGSNWDITGEMGKLTVKGRAMDSSVRATDSMAGITLGSAEGSDFLAGISKDAQRRPASHDEFDSLFVTIKSFKIKGPKTAKGEDSPRWFFTDSNVSAPRIGKVRLLNVELDPAGDEPFGVFAYGRDGEEVKSVRWSDKLEPKDPARNGSWTPEDGTPFSPAGSDVVFEVLPAPVGGGTVSPVAKAETDPVPHGGDAADDPAIWLHPDRPAESLLLATDKQGGLHVYDMDGAHRQTVAADARANGVDVLYDFPLGDGLVDLAVASLRAGDSQGVKVWIVDAQSGTLADATAGGTFPVFGGGEPYGLCTYHSAADGNCYFFVTNKRGQVEQYLLEDAGGDQVRATMVRQLDVGSQAEGCVADDELGHLYVAEESAGIWKFSAEPDGGDRGLLAAKVGADGLARDVEGLTIYYASDGTGYLIASSQGRSVFQVYAREGNNRHVLTIDPAAGAIDDVSDTDGIAVTNRPTSAQFPCGLLIVQDGSNAGGNQNFKLFDWQDIAGDLLTIDTEWSPRA